MHPTLSRRSSGTHFASACRGAAPGWTGKPRTDVALFDCDIHQAIKKQEDLYPYLPRIYREQVEDQGFRTPGSGYFNVPKRAARTDLNDCDADDINKHGDSYESLKETHLDLWNIDRTCRIQNF